MTEDVRLRAAYATIRFSLRNPTAGRIRSVAFHSTFLARAYSIQAVRSKRLAEELAKLRAIMILHQGCNCVASCMEDGCEECCDCGCPWE